MIRPLFPHQQDLCFHGWRSRHFRTRLARQACAGVAFSGFEKLLRRKSTKNSSNGTKVRRQMPVRTFRRFEQWVLVVLAVTIGLMAGAGPLMAQNANQSTNQPWMNSSLSPEERADL